jgi:hypothetical protein
MDVARYQAKALALSGHWTMRGSASVLRRLHLIQDRNALGSKSGFDSRDTDDQLGVRLLDFVPALGVPGPDFGAWDTQVAARISGQKHEKVILGMT